MVQYNCKGYFKGQFDDLAYGLALSESDVNTHNLNHLVVHHHRVLSHL